MKNKSYLTALRRKSLSSPIEFILNNITGLGIINPMLDYGCGYGADCDMLGIDGYDPYYRPYGIRHEEYPVIFCTYVLNVIPSDKDRRGVLDHITSLLTPHGVAFISVRNDKKGLRGWTKRGTWQGLVTLDFPIFTSNPNFIIYVIRKRLTRTNK